MPELTMPRAPCTVRHGGAYSTLSWLVLISVFFVVVAPLRTNFLGLNEDEVRDQREILLISYYSSCIFLGAITLWKYGLQRLVGDRYDISLLLAVLFFWCSIGLGWASGARLSPMSVMAPIFMVLLFHVFPRVYTGDVLRALTWILAAFVLAPLLAVFLPHPFDLPFDLYMLGSFRGFADSRTDYGYLAGVTFLLMLLRLGPSSFLLLPATFVALILSENRSALLAVIVCTAYLFFASRRYRSVTVVFGALVVGGIFLLAPPMAGEYGVRGVEFFEDSGGRLEIVARSLERISSNPLAIPFGAGAFYQAVNVSSIGNAVEPHNAVLQSVLNFGIVPTTFWYFLIGKLFLSLAVLGRVFMLYWLIFGQFHPGFDAYLFSPESFIPLLLAVHFGSGRLSQRNRSGVFANVGRARAPHPLANPSSPSG